MAETLLNELIVAIGHEVFMNAQYHKKTSKPIKRLV
jgi:hypothetical protein